MKALPLFLMTLLLLTSCKSDTSETKMEATETIALSTAEKIANAHGYEQWKNVEAIDFTFQVDRDTIKGKGRAWKWEPKSNRVTFYGDKDPVTYLRSKVDSTTLNIDRAFINDKYWFFIPFQLVWDTTATVSEPVSAEAPISKSQMNKITLTYSDSGGGYTPGDAYDIFYNDDYVIKEWIFRKGNAAEASLTTTFENYRDYNGIILALDHKQDGGNWNLNFTNVNVTF